MIKINSQLRFQVKRELAQRSYYKFFLQAFEALEPETELLNNWHIKKLCDELQEAVEKLARKDINCIPENIVCNVPPGSSKSLIFSVCLMGWAWLHFPHLRFAVASYAEFLSYNLSVKARDLIESEWYQQNWVQSGYFKKKFGQDFGLKEDQNTKGMFMNTFGGFRVATTVGGSITGAHVDVFIGDDLLNPKQADSDALRQTANDFWFKTVPSRSRNKKFFLKVLVMQRLHEGDTAGLIKAKGLKYKWIVIPAELNPDLNEEQYEVEVQPFMYRENYVDNLFFPARFPREVLRENEKELSTIEYVGQYLQRPAPARGNLIQTEYINVFRIGDESGEINRQTRYYYSDTAYGNKQSADNSATICFSVYKGHIYIWNIWKANLNFPDFIQGYKDFLIETGYSDESVCMFEPKASGLSIIQQLKTEMIKVKGKLYRINVIPDKAPTDNKITRLKARLPFIQSGGVHILANQAWIPAFLEECINFPNGTKDDQVDALEGAIRAGLAQNKKVDISIC